MTHALGRVVADGRTFNQTSTLNLVPSPGPLGGPRFVFLHFDSVSLSGGARLEVALGYDTDVFTAASGGEFWSRPADPSLGPVAIRITGGTGSARLVEYGSGEPTITPGQTPGTSIGSRSNPDPFLQTDPFQEPIYETRLECTPGFAWRNARCALPTVPDAIRDKVRAATGIIVEAHDFDGSGHGGHVSSCSGTLIAGDLFLTARHCLTDAAGRDVRSASVTFDYNTTCDGFRPPAHNARFFKVVEEVASGSAANGSDPPVNSDWVVVRLGGAPGQLPTPLEMRDSAPMAGETVFTMHHPTGSVKKTQAGVHGGGTNIVGFDYCGGSSGSALFDINGRLVTGPLSRGPVGNACTVTYAPIAVVKSGLSNPPTPPTPLDVMVVFDRSGSMSLAAPPSGRSKLDEAQDAAALFVQLVREGAGDRLGLVTFSSVAGLDRPVGPAATVKPLLVGPAPFNTGQIGAIVAGGNTSLGAGIGFAELGFGGGSTNQKAILLLTDGQQNTAPMVEEVESFLGSTKLNVIGFGSDADIDAPLLNRLAHSHGGRFTRALDGLALRKFFGLSFGNIFENGALADPDFVLAADQAESTPHPFHVCGEEHITVVLGWSPPEVALRAHIRTPTGKLVAVNRRVREVRGQTWLFWKVPLPYEGERDGTWTLVVDREPPILLKSGRKADAQAAVSAKLPEARYFFLITAIGGPTLNFLGAPRHIYTGDVLHPRVSLHFANATVPANATVQLVIDAPTIALGRLATDAGLRAPITSGDVVDGFHATLQMIAKSNGGSLPVGTSTTTLPLFDDGAHDDGAMESDGIYNYPLVDFTRAEGTYAFRAVATYGDGCTATREAHWAVHVQPGIDPGRTVVSVVDVTDDPGGRRATLVIEPRDRYDNPFGPGRGDGFTLWPLPGVDVVGPVKDAGDGRYTVEVTWDPAVTGTPGVLLQQPDRPPVPIIPGKFGGSDCVPDCGAAAGKLLHCLGLHESDVARVHVKSVCIEVELDDPTCRKPCSDDHDASRADDAKGKKPSKTRNKD